MTQDADQTVSFIMELIRARSQCHDSCADEMQTFLSFVIPALRAVYAFERSPVLTQFMNNMASEVVISLNEAFTDALHCIQSRSRENVESGRTVIRSQDEMAGPRKIMAISEGKKTPETITRAIKTGARTYVESVVQALKTKEEAYRKIGDVVKIHETLALGADLMNAITYLNKAIPFSRKVMKSYEEDLKRHPECVMAQQMEKEFARLPYLQLEIAPKEDVQRREHNVQRGTDEVKRREDEVQQREDEVQRREDEVQRREDEVQRREDEVQRREGLVAAISALQKGQDEIKKGQDEILAGVRGCHKTIESDRPPRYFILVPPIGQPLHKKLVEKLNPFSKEMDMYFMCQSLLVELKNAVEGNSAARSKDYTSEFSEPMRVKQPTVFVKHRRALNYGMAILRICLYAASSAVALGSIVPALELTHYEELVDVLEHGASLVDVTDSDDLTGLNEEQPSEKPSAARDAIKLDDGAYEVLRTFLKKHHDNDWKVAVKKTLKVVPRGEKSAYVCKANKSHETKWMELEHSRVDN